MTIEIEKRRMPHTHAILHSFNEFKSVQKSAQTLEYPDYKGRMRESERERERF